MLCDLYHHHTNLFDNECLAQWSAMCAIVVQLALAEAQYDLAAELLRFVVPPTENDNVFAAISGAHSLGQQPGAAKDSSSAPPRVRHRLMSLSLLPDFCEQADALLSLAKLKILEAMGLLWVSGVACGVAC